MKEHCIYGSGRRILAVAMMAKLCILVVVPVCLLLHLLVSDQVTFGYFLIFHLESIHERTRVFVHWVNFV